MKGARLVNTCHQPKMANIGKNRKWNANKPEIQKSKSIIELYGYNGRIAYFEIISSRTYSSVNVMRLF